MTTTERSSIPARPAGKQTLVRTARVGLIGAGGIGRAHAAAVTELPGAVLAGVCDVDEAAAATVSDEYGTSALRFEELAEHCDLVIVAAPPVTHPDLAVPLLEAGVPVLCEKPISIGARAAEKMVAAAERTGVALTMATKFRFVDDIRVTRQMIADGLLGEILKVEVTFAGRVAMSGRWNCNPSVAGGGVLIDNATHAVDLVRYLVGPITEVFAVPGPSAQLLAVEDSAAMLARTARGVLAQVDVTWSFRRFSPVYCAVYGSAGSVEVGWKGGRAVVAGSAGEQEFGTGYNKIDSLRDNLGAVLDALAAGQVQPVTHADMIASAAVIDAGYASMRQARWVDVAE